MDAAVKAEWLAALRSGDYEQTTGTLRRRVGRKVGYCCLGVLCDLAVKHGVIPPPAAVADIETENGTEYMYRYGPNPRNTEDGYEPNKPPLRSTGSLPLKVLAWAGLPTEDHDYAMACDPQVREAALSYHNDGNGATFGEIADMIEAEL